MKDTFSKPVVKLLKVKIPYTTVFQSMKESKDVIITRIPNPFGTFDFRVMPLDGRSIEFYHCDNAAQAAAQTLADASGGKIIED